MVVASWHAKADSWGRVNSGFWPYAECIAKGNRPRLARKAITGQSPVSVGILRSFLGRPDRPGLNPSLQLSNSRRINAFNAANRN